MIDFLINYTLIGVVVGNIIVFVQYLRYHRYGVVLKPLGLLPLVIFWPIYLGLFLIDLFKKDNV